MQIVIIIIIIIISITILIIFIINIMCITSTSNIINITSSNTSITLTAISVNGISVTTSTKTYSLGRRDYLHPKLILKNLSNSKKGSEKKVPPRFILHSIKLFPGQKNYAVPPINHSNFSGLALPASKKKYLCTLISLISDLRGEHKALGYSTIFCVSGCPS